MADETDDETDIPLVDSLEDAIERAQEEGWDLRWNRDEIGSYDANARQLRTLGRLLLDYGPDHIDEFNIFDGAFCEAEMDPSIVDDICTYLGSVNMKRFWMCGFTPDTVDVNHDHEIPCRLLSALARDESRKKKVWLNGFDLPTLSEGLAHLMESGCMYELELDRIPEMTAEEGMLLERAFRTKKEGFGVFVATQDVSPEVVNAIFSGLAGNPSIHTVLVDELSEICVPALCRMINESPCMNTLQYCNGTPTSGALLRTMLDNLSAENTLQTLKLDGEGLTDEHASVLSEILKKLPQLKVLSVEYHHFGAQGLQSILQNVSSESIEEICCLRGKEVFDGEPMGRPFANLFRKCHQLKTLSLDRDQIHSFVGETWDTFLQCETTELSLNFDGYGFFSGGGPVLAMYQSAVEQGWKIEADIRYGRFTMKMSKFVDKDGDKLLLLRTFDCRRLPEVACEWISGVLRCNDRGVRKILFRDWDDKKGPVALPTLFRLLPKAKGLQSLEFWAGDKLDEELLSSLREALSANRSLTHIKIHGHPDYSSMSDCFVLRNQLSDIPDERILPLFDKVVTSLRDSESEVWSQLDRRLHAGYFCSRALARNAISARKRKVPTQN